MDILQKIAFITIQKIIIKLITKLVLNNTLCDAITLGDVS